MPFRIRMQGWLNDKIAIINGVLWTEAKTRKQHKCGRCNKIIEKGFVAWRPVTERNGILRCNRLCKLCVGTPGPAKLIGEE
jgi:hypothetical protein